MLTGEIKTQIDRIWDAFWSGGISNPLEVIEQITYLLFLRRLDDLHTLEENKSARLKRPMERRVFPEGEDPKGRAWDDLRWSRFKHFAPAEMYAVVGEHVFPFLRTLGGNGSTYACHMKDARFTIPSPALLARVVDLLDDVPMEDRDTKGDVYEYMLGRIASAGQNGQFRTPRHIIRLMVELTAPQPDDVICDPASGTCGFLVAAGEYLREHHPDLLHDAKLKEHFHHRAFHGFDFDNTMLRIGSMNMLLHGVENPDIRYPDSLAQGHAADGERRRLDNTPMICNPPLVHWSIAAVWSISMGRTAGQDAGRRARTALINVLPRTAEVGVGGDGSTDPVIVNGTALRVKWIGEGWLRDVRSALSGGHGLPDVVVARRMSPGARKALADAGIGWVDETGAAEIATGTIVVSRTGRPPETAGRPMGWTPSVMGVVEALLCGTKATVAGTVEATGLSNGSCGNALRFLTDEGSLAAEAGRGRHSARRIVDCDRLLDAYASAAAEASTPLFLQVGVTWRDPAAGLAEVGAKWDAAGTAWACTGAVAASVLAPHLSSVTTADVYIDAGTISGLEAATTAAGLHPLEGGRLTLRPFPTVTSRRLSVRTDLLRLAPWPRVYADLRLVGVRGEEAAEHLRKVMRAR